MIFISLSKRNLKTFARRTLIVIYSVSTRIICGYDVTNNVVISIKYKLRYHTYFNGVDIRNDEST